jgi:hypothetical protein
MDRHFLATSSHFHSKLEKALLLAAQHLPAPQRATLGHNDRTATVWTSGVRP